jgi:hypothetical protein
MNDITTKELEELYRGGVNSVKEYIDVVEKAILNYLASERDTIEHLIEIGHFPEHMEVFNSMPTYVTMNNLINSNYLSEKLTGKTKVFQETFFEFIYEKGYLIEELTIDNSGTKDLVFIFDFSTDFTNKAKEYYKKHTKGKVDWVINQINDSLRYRAKRMERSLEIWFNGKSGFPELTLTEYEEIVRYYDQRNFKNIGENRFNQKDLNNIRLKISF